MLHSGELRPYSQTLDKAGKACQEQHSSLLRTFLYKAHKKFYNIVPHGVSTIKPSAAVDKSIPY
jgi:hypothetical protein